MKSLLRWQEEWKGNIREDLEFLEITWQLEEAVVGVRHGKVDPDEPSGEGGGDPGAERGLPHREPLVPPHPSLLRLRLLFPLLKNGGNRARRTETRDGIREEEEERRELSLAPSLSPTFPLPLPFSSLRLLFLAKFIQEGGREGGDQHGEGGSGAEIEYSLSPPCLFS